MQLIVHLVLFCPLFQVIGLEMVSEGAKLGTKEPLSWLAAGTKDPVSMDLVYCRPCVLSQCTLKTGPSLLRTR